MTPERFTVTESGVRLRTGPSTAYAIIRELSGGDQLVGAESHTWRSVRTVDGQLGWVADEFLAPVADETPAEPEPAPFWEVFHNITPERVFTLAELWPVFEQARDEYGGDPRIRAAITYQESGFRNWRVHRDGTGHGLIGLDDNGMLPDFEDWIGWNRGNAGRGGAAHMLPAGPQLQYLAFAIARYARQYGGDEYAAARAWHRGPGLMDDGLGRHYERLIRQHVVTLFG